MVLRWFGGSVLALLLGGCTSDAFGCEDDTQCTAGSNNGRCELNGYCSFPADDCPSGRRYGDAAGGGLAGLCVNTESGSTGESTSSTTTGLPATTGLTTNLTTSTSGTTQTTVSSSGTTGETETGTDSSGESSSSDASTGPEPSSSSGESEDLGLVLWYTFDDDPSVAGGAVSENGSGHDATCETGECPTAVEGQVGMAARFDGIDDMLATPDAPELRFAEALTLAFWVRLDAPPTDAYGFLAGKAFGTGSSNSYEFYYDPESDATAFNTDSSAMGALVVFGGLSSGQWIHMAGVWDGSTWRAYVDGALSQATAFAAMPAYDSRPFTIGADIDGGVAAFHFNGTFDEVRLYNRALDDLEIVALAQ